MPVFSSLALNQMAEPRDSSESPMDGWVTWSRGIPEAGTGRSLRNRGQPGLYMDFQANQDYAVRTILKRKKFIGGNNPGVRWAKT